MKQSVLILSLVIAVLSSRSALAQFPTTVIDDRKKQVTVEKQPKKVAAISTFGADLLAALDMQAAGISTLNHQVSPYLGDTTKNMIDLGEIHETNLEVLTQLKPDLIIGLRNYTEPFEKKFNQISPFLAYDLVTLDDSNRAIISASKALGKSAQGKTLNSNFAAQLSQLKTTQLKPLSVVLLWHWSDVPYAFYDHHLTVKLMSVLNAKNSVGRSPQPEIKKLDSAPISMEALLKLNPDVIISFKGEPGPFKYHPVWQQLNAVKQGRAYQVADHYVMPHGPIARKLVLEELAHLLHPEKFKAPNKLPTRASAKPMVFSNLY